MKKFLSIILSAVILGGSVLAGCGSEQKDVKKAEDPVAGIKAVASTDNYRNVYQIFTQSFCDSDNDGVGDLQGIISQLDYLNDGDPNSGDDLGVDAIWLTPINPSESYHKYSVEDYYDVDKSFGTLQDFDKLIEECHKRGIHVILDMVLNHISYKNQLFLDACEEVKKGKLDGKAEYFEFHEPDYYSSEVQVIKVGDYVCEANFSETMPEWNLKSDKTKEEFKKISKFWIDRGVDGFRLDAVKYFESKEVDGVEFLKWYVDTCRSLKPDIYLVGEDWSDDSEIKEYYASGIDSLFAFRFAQSFGEIVEAVNMQKGQSLVKKLCAYDSKMREANPDYINAMFLSNHDQVRIANALESKGLEAQKFAANIYMLVPGNSFTYYGEEIGMTAPDSDSDKWYRLPMVFDSENLQDITVDGASATEAPENGGAKQQLKDKNSLLNHYRRLITVKLQNPEIARGKITSQQNFDDSEVGAYFIESDSTKLLVIHNFSSDSEKQLEISDKILKNATVCADLLSSADAEHIELKDGKITLPAYSSVVLKSAD